MQAVLGEPLDRRTQVLPTVLLVRVEAAEILEIFKRGTPQEQNTVVQIMTRIDASNAAQYRAIK